MNGEKKSNWRRSKIDCYLHTFSLLISFSTLDTFIRETAQFLGEIEIILLRKYYICTVRWNSGNNK